MWQHMQLAKGTVYSSSVYCSNREYFTDLATVYVAEFRALYAAGLQSIQIDDLAMTYFMMPEFPVQLCRGGC